MVLDLTTFRVTIVQSYNGLGVDLWLILKVMSVTPVPHTHYRNSGHWQLAHVYNGSNIPRLADRDLGCFQPISNKP